MNFLPIFIYLRKNISIQMCHFYLHTIIDRSKYSYRKCGHALYNFSSYTEESSNFLGFESTKQSRHFFPLPVQSGSYPHVPCMTHFPSVMRSLLTQWASKATKVKSISHSLNVMIARRQLIYRITIPCTFYVITKNF